MHEQFEYYRIIVTDKFYKITLVYIGQTGGKTNIALPKITEIL